MSIWLWFVLALLVLAAVGIWFGTANRQKQQLAQQREFEQGEFAVPSAPEQTWREGQEGWEDTAKPEPELNVAFAGVAGAESFGPAVLAAGAHVIFEGDHYQVVGTGALKIDEGPEPEIWYEHLLRGGSSSHWISVEDIDGEIRLGWWSNRPELSVDPEADPVTVDGAQYRREGSRDALFAVSGLTGAVTQGEYRGVDFRAPAETREPLLRLAAWGAEADYSASVGRYLDPAELKVEPGTPGN